MWVVGESGIVLRWDGTAWTAHQSGFANALLSVWGAGTTDVWAAGYVSNILHKTR